MSKYVENLTGSLETNFLTEEARFIVVKKSFREVSSSSLYELTLQRYL